MILKALTLENFKGISEPVRIEFAPLTLLFGPNNAGKSTIVQALMYAREVLERNTCDAGRTVLGGDVVDLGGFRSLVHQQDLSRAIRMRFELDLSPRGLPTFREGVDFQPEPYASQDSDYEAALEDVWRELNEARSRLTTVWVELEISHRAAGAVQTRARPIVTRYSLGVGDKPYATISLPDHRDRPEIQFDYGAIPFGWTYAKGEMDDLEWDMNRVARRLILRNLEAEGWEERGLKKGARVAFADEPVSDDSNMISRDNFDKLVASIVAEDGIREDTATGMDLDGPSWAFECRQQTIKIAQEAAQLREERSRLESENRNPSFDEEWDSPHPWHAFSSLLRSADLQLFPELDHIDAYHLSETGSRVAACLRMTAVSHTCFDLALSGSALPSLDAPLQPFADIWSLDKSVGGSNWIEQTKDEVINFWSTIVIEPGRLLLRALDASTYLGPFRRLPSRAYRTETRPEAQSWASGLGAWDLLSLGSESPLRDAVSAWLTERFNTKYRVIAQRRKNLDVGGDLWNSLAAGEIQTGSEELREKLEGLSEESKLELEHLDSGLLLAPQDLGVGISQLIPVIIAALHNPCDQGSRAIMIEEPESNIHPAFQVVLADLFMTQAKANPNVVFLIETHSEHLMLRCLRRISETSDGNVEGVNPSVMPEDIAVHFVEPSEQGPVIHRIRIDKDGEFMDPWPRGFFPERMREVYGDDL